MSIHMFSFDRIFAFWSMFAFIPVLHLVDQIGLMLVVVFLLCK